MKILKAFFDRKAKQALERSQIKAFSIEFKNCNVFHKYIKGIKKGIHLEYIKLCNFELMTSGAKKPYEQVSLFSAATSAYCALGTKYNFHLD